MQQHYLVCYISYDAYVEKLIDNWASLVFPFVRQCTFLRKWMRCQHVFFQPFRVCLNLLLVLLSKVRQPSSYLVPNLAHLLFSPFPFPLSSSSYQTKSQMKSNTKTWPWVCEHRKGMASSMAPRTFDLLAHLTHVLRWFSCL